MVLSLHLAIPSTSSSQIVFFRESNEPDYNEEFEKQGEETGEVSTANKIF